MNKCSHKVGGRLGLIEEFSHSIGFLLTSGLRTLGEESWKKFSGPLYYGMVASSRNGVFGGAHHSLESSDLWRPSTNSFSHITRTRLTKEAYLSEPAHIPLFFENKPRDTQLIHRKHVLLFLLLFVLFEALIGTYPWGPIGLLQMG